MTLESDLGEFARIPLFAALEYEARRLLAFSAETRILRSRDVLFRHGEKSDCGYLLVNGTLEIERKANEGNGKIITAPTLVGEMALLTDTERPMTLVAATPATVLKISRNLFSRVLKEYPRSAMQTRALIEARLTAFSRELGVARSRSFLDENIANASLSESVDFLKPSRF